MAEIPVKKHWIVASFTPGEVDGLPDLESSAFGTVSDLLYSTWQEATTAAKDLAAQHPGSYYVVYEAMWYAHTDYSPVHLVKIASIAS